MTIARKKEPRGTKKRIIRIGDDDIQIMHVGFEVSEIAWRKMQAMIVERYGDINKKSQVMRILVNAYVLKILDIDELDKKIEKAAEKMEEVIYI